MLCAAPFGERLTAAAELGWRGRVLPTAVTQPGSSCCRPAQCPKPAANISTSLSGVML